MSFANGFPRSGVFAANRFENRIDSFRESALIILVSKMRFDPVLSNVKTGYVGERSFQAIRSLNKHFAILNEYEQSGPVVFCFLTNVPFLRYSTGVSCDVVIAFHFGKNGYYDLIRSIALELGELFVKTRRSFL